MANQKRVAVLRSGSNTCPQHSSSQCIVLVNVFETAKWEVGVERLRYCTNVYACVQDLQKHRILYAALPCVGPSVFTCRYVLLVRKTNGADWILLRLHLHLLISRNKGQVKGKTVSITTAASIVIKAYLLPFFLFFFFFLFTVLHASF